MRHYGFACGKFVTSRHIHERLTRELDKNLALRIEKADNEDKWTVFGRGVLHLSVLIETMRREGPGRICRPTTLRPRACVPSLRKCEVP